MATYYWMTASFIFLIGWLVTATQLSNERFKRQHGFQPDNIKENQLTKPPSNWSSAVRQTPTSKEKE